MIIEECGPSGCEESAEWCDYLVIYLFSLFNVILLLKLYVLTNNPLKILVRIPHVTKSLDCYTFVNSKLS